MQGKSKKFSDLQVPDAQLQTRNMSKKNQKIPIKWNKSVPWKWNNICLINWIEDKTLKHTPETDSFSESCDLSTHLIGENDISIRNGWDKIFMSNAKSIVYIATLGLEEKLILS